MHQIGKMWIMCRAVRDAEVKVHATYDCKLHSLEHIAGLQTLRSQQGTTTLPLIKTPFQALIPSSTRLLEFLGPKPQRYLLKVHLPLLGTIPTAFPILRLVSRTVAEDSADVLLMTTAYADSLVTHVLPCVSSLLPLKLSAVIRLSFQGTVVAH